MAYAKAQYIFVFQDVRGRYMSEGDFQDVRPLNKNKKGKTEIDEASDSYDAIDWLVKNIPNNNGRVGVIGTSYPGFYATEAALSNHPALKAVSPQAPVTDWFIGDDFHHNGAFFAMDGFAFYSQFGKPHPKPTMEYGEGFTTAIKDN
jgi:putative CocE/NonD family hydrolase